MSSRDTNSPRSSSNSGANRSCDVIVIGGTPAGIVFALRVAREGARVLLVNHTNHLGGMLANGLGVWDTRYERKRAPIYDEVREAIFRHYRETYGANSQQYADARPGLTGHSNGKFEPLVAENILTSLVQQEAGIEVVLNHYPTNVERTGATITSVTFSNRDGTGGFRATAQVFADCSYEADCLPLAGIAYRVGREARSEFDEPHAGVIFMQSVETAATVDQAQTADAQSTLRLRHFGGFQVRSGESTGESDANVQAINYRVILTNDPVRCRIVARPAHYDSERLRALEFGAEVRGIPNGKLCLNRPQLLGPHNAYVEGNWKVRREIMDAHWEMAMAMLWFRQNDSSVPEQERRRWREYGLAGDEFTDHDHRPHEIYLREGRRLRGRYILTQADTQPAAGLARPPLHADSIAFTEWYVDSHACTPRLVSGSLQEGKIMLHQETFPGQVPFRALMPEGVDNLLVPVNLSTTHVAWNTVRLEPTLMHIAEAAAYAAVQALHQHVAPAAIDVEALRQTLAQRGVMLAFFNDLESAPDDDMTAAAQYFVTRGFFPDYNAQLEIPLDQGTAEIWLRAATGSEEIDPMIVARAVMAASARCRPPLSHADFAKRTSSPASEPARPGVISRGEALLLLWSRVRAGSLTSAAKFPHDKLT